MLGIEGYARMRTRPRVQVPSHEHPDAHTDKYKILTALSTTTLVS
jgi:hypothetical protein